VVLRNLATGSLVRAVLRVSGSIVVLDPSTRLAPRARYRVEISGTLTAPDGTRARVTSYAFTTGTR
jgi:hypothetical protein